MRLVRFAVAAAGCMLLAGAARADESDYCSRVRARTAGDAALLFSPSLQLQGIKFPRDGMLDLGATTGTEYQLRAALSFSPLDIYKGSLLLRVGDADCEQHEATWNAQELLLAGADFGRLPALAQEAAYLDSQKGSWEAIVAKGEKRLAAGASTLLEASDLRKRAADLERKQAQVAGEIARLRGLGLDRFDGTTLSPSLAGEVERRAIDYEKEVSQVRRLDPWGVTVTGGIVPQDSPIDYFGIVQVSFNFGAFERYAKESRYLEARSREIANARYEVPSQLERFRKQVQAANRQAEQELAVVERSLSALRGTRAALADHADAPAVANALAVTDLAITDGESDRVYLSALVERLSRSLESDDGK